MPTSSSWLNRVERLLTVHVGGRVALKWVSRRALLYAVLVIGVSVFAYPFLWMIFDVAQVAEGGLPELAPAHPALV